MLQFGGNRGWRQFGSPVACSSGLKRAECKESSKSHFALFKQWLRQPGLRSLTAMPSSGPLQKRQGDRRMEKSQFHPNHHHTVLGSVSRIDKGRMQGKLEIAFRPIQTMAPVAGSQVTDSDALELTTPKQTIGRLDMLPQPPAVPPVLQYTYKPPVWTQTIQTGLLCISNYTHRLPVSVQLYTRASCVCPTIQTSLLCISNDTHRPPV